MAIFQIQSLFENEEKVSTMTYQKKQSINLSFIVSLRTYLIRQYKVKGESGAIK